MAKRIIEPQQIHLAQVLRHQQTPAERILWNKLRGIKLNGNKFRRQHPIGNYIVDFVSLENKLVIEIDGGQHNEVPIIEHDEKRTKWLESKGYRVLRFWNNDILTNIEGVYLLILEGLK
ncbi:MAG: endonuclease domain-containing protein [Chloroflexota bacterium]